VGRTPSQPYASFAKAGRLDGLKIGVMREYMDKPLFTDMDGPETIHPFIRRADLRKFGAAHRRSAPGDGPFPGLHPQYRPAGAKTAVHQAIPKFCSR